MQSIMALTLIIKVIGGTEYRQTWDHICEHHPDAVKPAMHTKVEVVGHPVTTPSTPTCLLNRALVAPTANCLLLPQHWGKLQPETLQQQPTLSGWYLQLQKDNQWLTKLMLHLSDLVMSVRHHSALMNRCKYNCDDVTGWASAPTHKQLGSNDT